MYNNCNIERIEWNEILRNIFGEIITPDGWLTKDWFDWLNENVDDYDEFMNTNEEKKEASNLMMSYDFEESEDGQYIRPVRYYTLSQSQSPRFRFYTRFSGHNAPKNKLQKAIVEHFKSLNGYIVDGEEFIKELKRKVEILSLGHSKCKKIELSSFENEDGVTISCGNEWTCHIYLYIINEKH